MNLIKKGLAAVVAAALPMTFFVGCVPPDATGIDPESIEFIQYDEIENGAPIAVIDTTLGEIRLELFPDEAPNTVKYFRKLVEEGFYDNKPIILEGDVKAMITGSTDETGYSGEVSTENGKKIEAEVNPNLWHFSGAVSAWGEKKGMFSHKIVQDSRFFIVGDVEASNDMASQMQDYKYPQKVIDEYKERGGMPEFTGSFTVFGQVYEGMDIVNEIVAKTTGGTAAAVEGVIVNSIALGEYSE